MSEEPRKLLGVCIPTYSGRICWQTALRLRQEEVALDQAGWDVELIFADGCSAIHIARNDLVEQAMRRGCDAVCFIDDDMDWAVCGITRMLAHDVDVIGAPTPLKTTPITWNVGWLDKDIKTAKIDERGLIEVAHVGTGLMVIRRAVFDRLREYLGPEHLYQHKHDGRECVAYFEAPLAWGEDARFCWHWRQAGGKVHVDPYIGMTHIIAPNWAVKGELASWLTEQDPFARAVAGLRSRVSPEGFFALHEAWGNAVWSATPGMLAAVYDLARQAEGPILECGSGLSTFVAALANPNADIHCLEHDDEWAEKLLKVLAEYNLDRNVRLHKAELISYPDGSFYDVSGLPDRPYSLAILDGPPHVMANRNLAYRALFSRIGNAALLVDDTNNPKIAEGLAAYTADRPGKTGVFSDDIKEFSIFIPEEAAQQEAA